MFGELKAHGKLLCDGAWHHALLKREGENDLTDIFLKEGNNTRTIRLDVTNVVGPGIQTIKLIRMGGAASHWLYTEAGGVSEAWLGI